MLLSVTVVVSGAEKPASAAVAGWTIHTAAGGGSPSDGLGDNGPATLARLESPSGVAGDGTNTFVAAGNRIRRVDAAGTITTLAGSDEAGFAGDGSPSALAKLDLPTDVAHDGGAVFIADRYNHRVRRVSPDGTITTVAGASLPRSSGGGPNGLYAGDGGPATLAHLSQPIGLAFDQSHNLYVVDSGNSVIRRIAAGLDGAVDGDPDELIATVAGNRSTEEGLGDGGPATAAGLSPSDVAVDAGNNLYIVDNQKVRKVTAGGDGMVNGDADDVIATVAGTAWYGFSGDGGPATQAQLSFPTGVAVDRAGNLFIGDSENQRIRRVDTAGRISTVAGTGERSFNVSCPTPSPYCGDGGHAVSAALFRPFRLDVGDDGDLLIADSGNERVRRVPTALMLVEDSPDPAKVGEPFTYTVTVGGLPAPATGVRVHVTLAPKVSFVGASASQGQCSAATGTVTCALGTLARGSTSTVRIDVRPTGAGIVESSVTLAADQSGAVPYNDTVSAQTRVSAADCGRVITKNTVLKRDIGPCGGNGIIVGADRITIDLKGRRIFGFPGAVDGHSAGIRLPMRSGVVVKNGTVSDFDAGVVVRGGGGNRITGLVVQDNVGPDRPFAADLELSDGIVLFESAGNTISNNQVLRNGIFDGIGVLGEFSDDNRIEGNVVADTVGPAWRTASDGQGIIVNATSLNEDPTRLGKLFVERTRIANNMVRHSGAAGISNVNSINGSIVANIVEDNGRTNRGGNGIGVQLGPQAETDQMNMLIQGNKVHGNAWNGISIPAGHTGLSTTSPAKGNQVLDNNAAHNSVDNEPNSGGFDLHDGNNCDGNTWSGNTWGSGGFSPPCTAAGGTGVP